MKVVYDLSVAGLALRGGFKTGIFRVLDKLAEQLLASSECELRFCAFTYASGALEYIESRFDMSSAQLCISTRGRIATSIASDLERTVTEIDSDNHNGLSLLEKKIRRQLGYKLLMSLRAQPFEVDIKSLFKADIIHTNFFAAPEQVRANKNIVKFLTVFDLIPILYPQYFSQVDHPLKQIVDQLDKDDWILCISETTKQDLCNYTSRVDPDKVFVTPLAASEAFYPCKDSTEIARVRRKYGIPQGPYVLSLCTFEPRKNIDHTIRSFLKLIQQEKVDDLNLVLAGGKGWKDEKIFNQLNSLGAMNTRVITTGFVEDEDLPALYSGALVFVYPSLYEGFGLPPLEAMQCGTPVITSNTSSLPEVVGDAGIMLDPHDEDGLCQEIMHFYRDPIYQHKYAASALLRSGLFSWKDCTSKTIQAYKTSLGT